MQKEKLIQGVKNFTGKKLAVIGDVALDKYVFGKVERVNPESPAAPLLKVEKKEYRLGCGENVDKNLATLNASVTLFCVIGNDFYKPIFEELCKKSKVKLVNITEGETIVKERSIESEFNKYLMRSDDGEHELKSISENSENQLYNSIRNSGAEAIILSDYNKCIFKNNLAKKIIEWANNKNIPIIVDPKPQNINSFSSSTILCPNIKEAREIIGNNGDEKEITKKLKEKLDTKYMIVTCGKKGMVVYNGEGFTLIPTKARELVDVTGAGDTVTSLIALSLISGLSLEESAHVANHAAGIVIGKQGTSSLTQEELIQDLMQNFN